MSHVAPNLFFTRCDELQPQHMWKSRLEKDTRSQKSPWMLADMRSYTVTHGNTSSGCVNLFSFSLLMHQSLTKFSTLTTPFRILNRTSGNYSSLVSIFQLPRQAGFKMCTIIKFACGHQRREDCSYPASCVRRRLQSVTSAQRCPSCTRRRRVARETQVGGHKAYIGRRLASIPLPELCYLEREAHSILCESLFRRPL